MSRERGRLRRHWVRWTLLLLVLFLAGLAALTALQARTAYRHLKAVEARAPQVKDEVRAGDADALRRSVVELRQHTRVAKEAVDGWNWTVLGKLPWVGAFTMNWPRACAHGGPYSGVDEGQRPDGQAPEGR